MAAVAVWRHRPSARELLDARLAKGWTPTATATKEGARVLGYAACAVSSPVVVWGDSAVTTAES